MKSIINIFLAASIATIFFACNNANDANVAKNNNATTATANAQNGAVLFTTICSTCHGVQASDNKNNAPILANIKSKWPQKDALIAFIKNAPEQLQQTAYGKALHEQWKNSIQMPPYIGMSDAEINDVVAYLYEL